MDYGQLYDENYYETSCGKVSYLEQEQWVKFFGMIADKIIETLHPTTVLDVGCAVGYLVAALRDRGVDAYGIDISEFAISKVREDIKPYCRVCSAVEDLPDDLTQKYDLVTTIEVAEHLYEEDGIKFIENICKYTNTILFSSTPDDITEKTHFNVQQAEYWAKKFAENKFFKELTYDASFIAPQAFLFVKKEYKVDRLVENYERNLRILKSRMNTEGLERDGKIIYLNNLLLQKEEQVRNLEKASNEKDIRIQELIQMNQIRIILNTVKWLGYNLIHNLFTRSAKKFIISMHTVGFKNTVRRVKHKLRRQPYMIAKMSVSEAQSVGYDENVDFLLNQRLRNIQPIQTVIVENGHKRLNFVTDSIDAHSLLGGVATALIVATEFANRNNMTLRIITRTTPVNPVNYENIMKISGIPVAQNVTYYSDYDRDVLGNIPYKLEISEEDIFFATSWWSAAAIKRTSLRKKFYYIIQEVETFFYPHGDEHYLCSQIMRDENIYYIINSHYLYEYFKVHEPNIVRQGFFFEPAFPKALYQPQPFIQKKKYKLFFYARPNNPRNMFFYGVRLLEKSIESMVLDTNEWDIYCAGQAIPELKFSNGYIAHNLGLMNWQEYGKFLSGVDVAMSLMYTPHPSYPPFDVACSGGVVVSNSYENKKVFDWCKNVIFSSIEEDEFIESMAKAIALAKDMPQRQKNFEDSTIPRVWQNTLTSTLKFMEEKLKDV